MTTPAKSKKSGSKTNLKRLDALRDNDIDLSDIPEITARKLSTGILRRALKPVGRPPLPPGERRQPIEVTLSTATIAKLREIGGTVSQGIELAASRFK
jgi:hypothetical protein